MTRRLGRRDLSGWTVTGGSGCSGREARRLPGGGVDWSRPRCEPDNRLHVRAGRLLGVVGPLLAALPVMWFGLVLQQRLQTSRFAAWVFGLDWTVIAHRALWVLALAAAALLGGYLARVWPTPSRRRLPAPVDVTVTTPTPGPYPVGQVLYRRFDSPVMLPTGTPSVPAGEPAAIASGRTIQGQGRWSA